MSIVTLIFPWIIGSFIATPFIGAMMARTLGSDEFYQGRQQAAPQRHANSGARDARSVYRIRGGAAKSIVKFYRTQSRTRSDATSTTPAEED